MRFLVLIFGLMMSFSVYAQSLNAYKYIFVPDQFEGFKEPNQYRLNSYARHFFQKNGFQLLEENPLEWPEDALQNPCLILNFNAIQEKSLLKNKLKTTLENCKKEVLFQSIGSSKYKEFSKGFKEAIRLALAKYPLENYSFDASLATEPLTNKNVLEPKKTNLQSNEIKLKTVESKNEEQVQIYSNGNVFLRQEIANAEKVLFVNDKNPNQILVRGKISSLQGVYKVSYTNQNGEQISTIGYFENGNWVMDLPSANGSEKTVFTLNE